MTGAAPQARPWLRPRAARWFEALVARDDTTLALEALAATGAVELEARCGAVAPPGFAELGQLLQRHGELALRYRAYWPRDGLEPSAFPDPPAHSLQRSVERIEAWARDAEPHIRQLQRAQADGAPLRHWHAVARRLASGPLDLSGLAGAGAPLLVRLAVSGAESRAAWTAPPEGSALLAHAFEADGTHYLLSVGTADALDALEQQVQSMKGQWLMPPDPQVAGELADAGALEQHLRGLDGQDARARAALDRLSQAHGLREALANVLRLQWVLDNVRSLESGPLFTWVTGWTRFTDAGPLERSLDASGARALVRMAPGPPGLPAPMLLDNPWWARPFEIFAQAMGIPGGTEADPSALLALAVPLMFGYMFGDLGQGLVIAAAGLVLQRRYRIARLFVAGGLSAAVFGLLFGCVFGLHALTPLWTAPLDEPLAVLMVPLAGGAVLLCIGLLLGAAQAHWRGEIGTWLATDAALLVCYLGLLAAIALPADAPIALAIAAGGALWFCAGHALLQRRAAAGLTALGEGVERLLQLLINTLSFARVGAFALAHAGLSSAIVALMHAAGNPAGSILVLVVGNLVVMLLEGLVVSIQTTRLVLFEFFARFLQAQGRVFRPLPLPPSTLQEKTR